MMELNARFILKRRLYQFLTHLLLILYSVIIIFPIIWVFLNSLKNNAEIFSSPFGIPDVARWVNYVSAWVDGNIGTAFFNSVAVTGSSVIVIAIIAPMAAYALARLNFSGKKYIFFMFLSGMFIAPVTGLVPLLKLLKNLNLVNTYPGLVLPYVAFALPLSIFIMRSFFIGISTAIEDSAIIDGASQWQIYSRIMFPLALPSVYTVLILQTVYIWNEFLFALVFLRTEEMFTLPRALASFMGSFVTEYGALNAAVIMAAIPTIFLYILFSTRIRRGMAVGFSSKE